MRARELDACTADEWHGLLTAVDKARHYNSIIRVDRTALDHLLKDHARLQRENGRPDT